MYRPGKRYTSFIPVAVLPTSTAKAVTDHRILGTDGRRPVLSHLRSMAMAIRMAIPRLVKDHVRLAISAPDSENINGNTAK